MAELNQNLLSVTLFLPLLWATAGLIIPVGEKRGQSVLKVWTLLGSLVTLALSVSIYLRFSGATHHFEFVEKISWIPALGVFYSLGVDGISLWLVLLTTFLMPIAILGSFNAVDKRFREYYFLLLSLETGMIGAFLSLDIFLFYVFWEAMLLPMYFLIGIWGGKERVYAAMKFFLFTLVGSLLMLVAIFFMAYQHKLQFGNYSTLITDLYLVKIAGGGFWSAQSLLFLAFALAFAIKVPLFPLHTWLPDAHVQAPTAGSVILAAVLLKMGGFGLMRYGMPLFPSAVAFYQGPMMLLGAVAIVYGAWMALVQPDVKKLVAYSSVSHMGYVIFGLFSLNEIAVTGSYYQMLNHGISTGALFLLVGMIYERRHTRQITDFGGIAKVMPLFAVVFMIVTFSSVALPGTNGFIGEFLILLGSWKVSPTLTAVSTLGVIFGAVYMLWMFRRVMFGPLMNEENKILKDLSFREGLVLAPLLIAVFFMGFYPNFFFVKMQPTIEHFITQTQGQESPHSGSPSAYANLQTGFFKGN